MGRKYHEPIPRDFSVRPTKKKGPHITTCGYCKLSWDDSKVTSYTPAPSARCPFEYFHIYNCDNCGEPIFSYKPDSTLIASDGDEDRPFRWGIDCSCGKRRGW